MRICIGKHDLYLQDKIIYITPDGDVLDYQGIEIERAVSRLTDIAGCNVNILGNLNKAGKPSAKVRRIGIKMFENNRINKIALFGLHPVARIIAYFITEISKNKRIKFFQTKEEALAWFRM